VLGQGFVKLELDGIEVTFVPGYSINVPIGSKHIISCGVDTPPFVIEVQTGLNLDEGDIVRYEDDFGPTNV
jgi:mannose-6-phosphate isomerase-like protein (cupin superfamily)